MRFEKFLLDVSEIPDIPKGIDGDIIAITNNISQKEQYDNLTQCRIVEAVFHTVCELFELADMELQTTGYYHSLLMVTKKETEFNNQTGVESPRISRSKLKSASVEDVCAAIIDLLLQRKTWTDERQYKTLRLPL